MEAIDDALQLLGRSGQQVVLARGGDDDVGLVDLGNIDRLADGCLQGVEALARLGGDGVGRKRPGSARVTAIGDERVGGRRVEVGLVEDEQDVLALAVGHHLVGLLLRRPAIDHPEHEQGFVQLLPRALDAHLLHDVVGVAQSGRIDEAEGEAPDEGGLLDAVACGAVDVAHEGAVLADQVVEECRFAHIGLADDGHGNALLDGLADMVGPGQRGHVVLDAAGQGEELAAVGKDQVVVVGEVQFEFEQRGEPEQPFAQRLQGRADVALELAEGQPVGGLVGGTDQVGHGLGLAQVHLAVEVGPAGVFARFGLAASGLGERVEDLVDDVGRSVAGDLYRVLSRVGVGRTVEGDDDVVDLLALGTVEGGVAQRGGRTGGEVLAEQAAEDGIALAAAHSHDGDGAPHGGGQGADGIVGVVCHQILSSTSLMSESMVFL